jgi:hypothetical protein
MSVENAGGDTLFIIPGDGEIDINAVPEPSSAVLLIGGIASLALARRRQHKLL